MKWLYCVPCNRIFRSTSAGLQKHIGHRPIRFAGNEPWWHCLYQPALLLDWLRLKLGRA